MFMKEKHESVPELSDDDWLFYIFFVAITEKCNQLNKDLQGQNKLIIDAGDLIKIE